jgi:sterol 3beta-glucosyltransferase
VVPHIVDQFFHGRRVHELGLGPAPIPKAKLDSPGLIRAFRESRASVARAREVGHGLAGTSGAELAAEHLERHAAR